MERKVPTTDCAFLLERKLFQSASIQDLGYFLGTSDAKVPQVISKDFAGKFKELTDKAINSNDLQSVSTLIQVLVHIVQQDVTQSIDHLISSDLHSNFEPIVGFYMNIISDKSCHNSGAINPFKLLMSAIIDYSRKMNDHCVWLMQNFLPIILLILGDRNVPIAVKLKTSEDFLNIFEEEDRKVSPTCRAFVMKNEQLFDDLSKRVLGSLHRSGHLQLQELMVEITIRMWMTDMRRHKAMKWFENNKTITEAFLAISYDEFDYGVRMFLNQLNGSTERRRILTLGYKELQIGKQIFTPSNQWCNCVDICYGSKLLDVRYPYEETGLHDEHKCLWKLGIVCSSNLVSFSVTDNLPSNTVDLHLRFQEPTCRVLTDFSLDNNQSASDLVIRFNSIVNVDARRMTHFISALFGSKYLAVFGSQNDHEPNDASFIQLSQESRRKTPEGAPNPTLKTNSKFTGHTASQRVSIPSKRTNLGIKSSSQRQSESQVLMMKNLVFQDSKKRNEDPVKPMCRTSIATWNCTEQAQTQLKSIPETCSSRVVEPDQRQTQMVHTPTMQFVCADIHRQASSLDSSGSSDHSDPPLKGQHRKKKVPGVKSYNAMTSIPVSMNRARYGQMKPRLTKDSKGIIHQTDSDRIHGESSDEFVAKKKAKSQRKDDKVNDIIPETQVVLNTSKAMKSPHNVSAVTDTSVDLMMQCLHGSGVSERAPEIFDGIEDIPEKQTDADPKRITRSQRQKQSVWGRKDSETQGTHQRTKQKDGSSGTESAVSKVNHQFEKLVSQFKEEESVKNEKKQESVEGEAKNANTGRKKKRSLLDAEVWQQLDEMVPVEHADDPAIKSVKKRPYADRFVKHTTTNENDEKTARGKQRNSTRKALGNLNIEPRQDKVKNRTAEVRKRAPARKKRKKDLPLPYEELEEVVEINESRQDENVFSPIEAVAADMCSPLRPARPRNKAKKDITRLNVVTRELRPREAKKKSKVSFDPQAKTDSQNDRKASAKYFNPKRKKMARLFDSVSESTSGTASDPSWIMEHATRTQQPSKPQKTYKGIRIRKRRERKKAIKKRSLEQVIESSFHRSVSEERSDASPMTNNSLLSGVSLLQSLGSASNMNFDQIAAESDCLPSETGPETAPTRLCDLSDIRLEWNKLDLGIPAADEDRVFQEDAINLHDCDVPEQGKKPDANDNHSPFSSTDHGSETEPKEIGEFHDLDTARVNNNTPTDSHDRFNFTEKIFFNRKKAMTPVASPPAQKKYLKSKKKLEMRPCSTMEDTTSSDCDFSASDHRRAKSMMKLVKNYVRVIDKKWAEGHVKRASCIESYQSKIDKQVKHYETQMERLKVLEGEALQFVDHFNTRINTVMKDAAKGLLQSKLACKDLTVRLAHQTRHQDQAMNDLRRQISRDLKKQVARVDKEDAKGK